MKDAEPSGRDSKLCSQPNSLKVTFEEPHTSIMLLICYHGGRLVSRGRVTYTVLQFAALTDDVTKKAEFAYLAAS